MIVGIETTGSGGSRLSPLHNGSRNSGDQNLLFDLDAAVVAPYTVDDENVGIVRTGENGSNAAWLLKSSSKPLSLCVVVEHADLAVQFDDPAPPVVLLG